MSLQRPKVRPAIRVIAAGCVLLWLAATSYCSLRHLVEGSCDPHDPVFGAGGVVAEGAFHQHLTGHPAQDGEEQDGHSHHQGDAETCCSTLHALAQAPQLPLEKPDFHTVDCGSAFLHASRLACPTPEPRLERQAKTPECVFTLEVYLGPAFRSHAPPASLPA